MSPISHYFRLQLGSTANFDSTIQGYNHIQDLGLGNTIHSNTSQHSHIQPVVSWEVGVVALVEKKNISPDILLCCCTRNGCAAPTNERLFQLLLLLLLQRKEGATKSRHAGGRVYYNNIKIQYKPTPKEEKTVSLSVVASHVFVPIKWIHTNVTRATSTLLSFCTEAAKQTALLNRLLFASRRNATK